MMVCFFFLMFFIFSYSPFLMLMSIVGQALFFIKFLLYLMNYLWFSLAIILVYVGGVLIIFLYLNSIITKLMINQKTEWLLISLVLGFTSGTFYVFYMEQSLLSFLFLSIKELFFLWFILFLFLFIYLINTLLLNTKSPLNNYL